MRDYKIISERNGKGLNHRFIEGGDEVEITSMNSLPEKIVEAIMRYSSHLNLNHAVSRIEYEVRI